MFGKLLEINIAITSSVLVVLGLTFKPKNADFAKLSFINQQWDLTFDTKNQFLDPKLVGFGSLNVKIGL